MKKFNNEEYIKAFKEMEEKKGIIDPLVALLLLNSYDHKVFYNLEGKLPVNVIEHIDNRFHLIAQLLLNKKRISDYDEFPMYQYSDQERYNQTFCNFKEVMVILGRSKGTVEALIKEGKIHPTQNKTKGKRSFFRAEIVEYSERTRY